MNNQHFIVDPKKKADCIITGFNESGQECHYLDKSCCAIQYVYDKETKIYKIRHDKHRRAFNPLKKSNFYSLGSLDKNTSSPKFKFREVNQLAFLNYIKFLQTKHDSYLFITERNI